MSEQASLSDYGVESPQQVIRRIESHARDAVSDREVSLDV